MEESIKIQEEFENLIEQLERLKSINELTSTNSESAKQVINQAEDFTKTLGTITKTYLDDNNKMFVEKLMEFQKNINLFENEVIRLIDTDFTSLFNDLQKTFILKTKADIEIELHKFDEKVKNFQPIISLIKKEAERLEGIDLEKYFDKQHEILDDISEAVNSINLTLSNLNKNLSGIAQLINSIETSIETSISFNFKETNQQITSTNKSILDQNILIKKEIFTNRIIQIIGFIVLLIALFLLKNNQ